MNDLTTGNFSENIVTSLSTAGETALRSVQRTLTNVEHGMYENIPIACRGKACPYVKVCKLRKEIDIETIVGDPCPIEVAEMIEIYNKYYVEFNLEQNDNYSIRGLVKELVDKELMIRRADKAIAMEADFMEDITTFDKQGNELTYREISKPVEYKEKLHKRRGELLTLLNATPKDKAGNKLTVALDPSSWAAGLMEKYRNNKEVIVIDTENYNTTDG